VVTSDQKILLNWLTVKGKIPFGKYLLGDFTPIADFQMLHRRVEIEKQNFRKERWNVGLRVPPTNIHSKAGGELTITDRKLHLLVEPVKQCFRKSTKLLRLDGGD
jgi:hypothetical protein